MDRHGKAGEDRHGVARPGMARQAGVGTAVQGLSRIGKAGKVRRVLARRCEAGTARLGVDRIGTAGISGKPLAAATNGNF